MRTTLDIADDILAAARSIAREQGRTVGSVVSELTRRGLGKPIEMNARNGVPILKAANAEARVTLRIVNALRDEAP